MTWFNSDYSPASRAFEEGDMQDQVPFGSTYWPPLNMGEPPDMTQAGVERSFASWKRDHLPVHAHGTLVVVCMAGWRWRLARFFFWVLGKLQGVEVLR